MVILNLEINSSNTSKQYIVNENEKLFFETLSSRLKENNLSQPLNLIRMSNGSISVNYSTYPIGKIKLQGRKHWMLILRDLYESDLIEGSLGDFILDIDSWIAYIKKYLRKG